MNQRSQVIPLGANSPRNIGTAGTPADPRAQRRDDCCCIFTWNTHPDILGLPCSCRWGRFCVDFQDIDRDRCARQPEELRQSGREVCAGGESVEGLGGCGTWLEDTRAVGWLGLAL